MLNCFFPLLNSIWSAYSSTKIKKKTRFQKQRKLESQDEESIRIGPFSDERFDRVPEISSRLRRKRAIDPLSEKRSDRVPQERPGCNTKRRTVILSYGMLILCARNSFKAQRRWEQSIYSQADAWIVCQNKASQSTLNMNLSQLMQTPRIEAKWSNEAGHDWPTR